jgi:hypothetical protein
LRPCAYLDRNLKDAEIRYIVYDKEALAMVEVVSRVWRIYLLGCKCSSVVTDHATIVHLLKQSSDKWTDRQTHWLEKIMPHANLMRIFYRTGILNEADPVPRRPGFSPLITRAGQMRVSDGVETLLELILMVMTLYYSLYRHYEY